MTDLKNGPHQVFETYVYAPKGFDHRGPGDYDPQVIHTGTLSSGAEAEKFSDVLNGTKANSDTVVSKMVVAVDGQVFHDVEQPPVDAGLISDTAEQAAALLIAQLTSTSTMYVIEHNLDGYNLPILARDFPLSPAVEVLAGFVLEESASS